MEEKRPKREEEKIAKFGEESGIRFSVFSSPFGRWSSFSKKLPHTLEEEGESSWPFIGGAGEKWGEGRGFSAIVKEEIYSRSWNERTVEKKSCRQNVANFPEHPYFPGWRGQKKDKSMLCIYNVDLLSVLTPWPSFCCVVLLYAGLWVREARWHKCSSSSSFSVYVDIIQ